MRRTLALMLSLPLVLAAPATAAPSDKAEETAVGGSMRSLYMELIRQARADGKARAALAYLDDFDRQHPNDREAQVLRVNCLLDLGQIAGAQQALARIPASERSGGAMAARGHVLAAEERWGEAATAYAAAQAASPADSYIGNALGYAELRAGHTDAAIETLRRALDLAPDAAHGDAVVRNNLALALTTAGRTDEAAALLARVRDTGERARLRSQLALEAARISSSKGGAVPNAQ